MCEQKFASKDERCMLTSTLANANECRSFLTQRSHVELGESVPVRLVQFVVESTDGPIDTDKPPSSPTSSEHITLHVVVFPANTFPIAKQFWQHTGMGISSRVAERCLNILGELERGGSTPVSPTTPRPLVKPCNRHYSATKGRHANPNLGPSFSRLANGPSGPLSPIVKDVEGEGTPIELDTYLEERYGRNLPYSAAPMAKRAMRRRIAGTLMHDSNWLAAGSQEADLGPSWRDKLVTENDIFLFPTGMTAIWHAHKLARDTGPAVKSVCFG
jgi:cystathionine gamma-synthase